VLDLISPLLREVKAAIFWRVFRKLKWIFRIALALFALLLLLSVVGFLFPQQILCLDSGSMKADVIVVLGGGSRDRPEQAAELFRNRAAPRIIVSGLGDDEINRKLLMASGVPAKAIQLESKSRTTRENAEFTDNLLRQQKVKRVILVTSWYHSRRALKSFEHFAPEIRFYSRPSYFDFKRSDWSYNFSKRIYLEYEKLGGYWIYYGIWPV